MKYILLFTLLLSVNTNATVDVEFGESIFGYGVVVGQHMEILPHKHSVSSSVQNHKSRIYPALSSDIVDAIAGDHCATFSPLPVDKNVGPLVGFYLPASWQTN